MLKALCSLAIVIYVVAVEVSGQYSGNTIICSTQDCKLTERDFADFMNPTANPCTQFFEYACGKTTNFLQSLGYTSQYKYIQDEVKKAIDTARNVRWSDYTKSQDGEFINLAKRQVQSCEHTSTETKLRDAVAFLNALPIRSSWWELETFLVKKGFPSSLVSHEIDPSTSSVMVFRPLTVEAVKKFSNLPGTAVTTALNMLRTKGLSSSITKLLAGCSAESWANGAYPLRYTQNSRVSLDQWPDYWIDTQSTTSSLSREDWIAYFNSLWPANSRVVDWVHRVNVNLDASDIVSELGQLWEDDTNERKSIITCRAFRELMRIIPIPTSQKSLCEPEDAFIDLIIDRQLFPESLKKGINRLAASVNLQTKRHLYDVARLGGVPKRHFLGTAKIDLYNHLVNASRHAILNFTTMVRKEKCCGNCGMDDVKRHAGRVIRFEKRYPPGIKEYWHFSRTEMPFTRTVVNTFSSGLNIGIETERFYPVLPLGVPNSTSYVEAVLEQPFHKEIIYNRNGKNRPNFDQSFIAASQRHVKFRTDRPAALNYGGLGSMIAMRSMTSNLPDEYGPVSEILDRIWKAYQFDKRLRLTADYGGLSTLPHLDNDKLFFLAFANVWCGTGYGTNLNSLLTQDARFKETYNCSPSREAPRHREKSKSRNNYFPAED